MSDTCPTIRVKAENNQGFRTINEADFDPNEHELFGVEPAADDQTEAKTAAEVIAMGSDSTIAFATFKAEAKKLLGDSTPANKLDILAALAALEPAA